MHKLEDLKIWKKAMLLAKEVYLVIAELPNEEKYNLISQVKRSAVSIPSNIAEGAGRNSKKEFIHFLSIANGSSYELQTQLQLSVELNLIKKERINLLIDMIIEIQKMNYAFQKNLNK